MASLHVGTRKLLREHYNYAWYIKIKKGLTLKNLKKETWGCLGPYMASLSLKKKKLVRDALNSSGLARAMSMSLSLSSRESRPRQKARASRFCHGRSMLPCTDNVSKVTL